MMTLEITLAKDRKGRPVTQMNCQVDEETVSRKGLKIVKSPYGHVVILDFKKMRAEFWRPGTPGDRRYSSITIGEKK